jgi:RND family efflux transporter MFP subunit
MRFYFSLVLLTTLLSFSVTSYANDVKVIYPHQKSVNQKLVLTGTVMAEQDADLASLEEGLVETLLVDAGDHVTKGQMLLTLDNTLATIQLEQAQAIQLSAKIQYQEAQRLYDEIVKLAKKQVVAKTLSAERKANRANSQALLARATAELALQQEIVNRHILTAPFSGIIAERAVDVGEWVSQQSQLLQLVSDNDLRLLIDIPQEYILIIQNPKNSNVTVISDIDPSETYQLTLSQLVAVSNPVSRTVQARIDLPQKSTFIPGMSARVTFLLPQQGARQVLLPKSALKRHPDGSYSVFSVIDNKVKRHSIKVLQHLGEQVSVSGVPENAAIIVSGNELLTEGSSVNASPAKASD